MRQVTRFILRPWSFFNQLQWSSHHAFMLFAFLGVAIVETQMGKQQALWLWSASLVEQKFALSFNTALWLVTFAKLVVVCLGAALVATLVWFLGTLFGRHTSRRVLFRRLSVVFTVLLSGYTVSHLGPFFAYSSLVSSVLLVWALILGYFAIREQFALTHMETTVLGLFTLFLALSTWHVSHNAWEKVVQAERDALAKRPGAVHQPQAR